MPADRRTVRRQVSAASQRCSPRCLVTHDGAGSSRDEVRQRVRRFAAAPSTTGISSVTATLAVADTKIARGIGSGDTPGERWTRPGPLQEHECLEWWTSNRAMGSAAQTCALAEPAERQARESPLGTACQPGRSETPRFRWSAGNQPVRSTRRWCCPPGCRRGPSGSRWRPVVGDLRELLHVDRALVDLDLVVRPTRTATAEAACSDSNASDVFHEPSRSPSRSGRRTVRRLDGRCRRGRRLRLRRYCSGGLIAVSLSQPDHRDGRNQQPRHDDEDPKKPWVMSWARYCSTWLSIMTAFCLPITPRRSLAAHAATTCCW